MLHIERVFVYTGAFVIGMLFGAIASVLLYATGGGR